LPNSTETAPALLSAKTTSGIPNVETGKQAEKTTTSDNKKAHLPLRRQAPVVRKRTQEAPAVAADRNTIEPVSQQNY